MRVKFTRIFAILLCCSFAVVAQNPKSAVYPLTDAAVGCASNGITPTTLVGSMDAVQTGFTVSSGVGWCAPSWVLIDAEIIACPTLVTASFSACARGAQGTTPTSHAPGASVEHIFTADAWNQAMANLKLATNQFVDPRAYGAVGDGIADDTAAVQAAINAKLGCVTGTPATYKITAPGIAAAADAICVEGVGDALNGNGATTTFKCQDMSGACITLGSPSVEFFGSHLRRFRVLASGTTITSSTAIGIDCINCNGTIIEQVSIRDFQSGTALRFRATSGQLSANNIVIAPTIWNNFNGIISTGSSGANADFALMILGGFLNGMGSGVSGGRGIQQLTHGADVIVIGTDVESFEACIDLQGDGAGGASGFRTSGRTEFCGTHYNIGPTAVSRVNLIDGRPVGSGSYAAVDAGSTSPTVDGQDWNFNSAQDAVHMSNNYALKMKDSSGTEHTVMALTNTDAFSIGAPPYSGFNGNFFASGLWTMQSNHDLASFAHVMDVANDAITGTSNKLIAKLSAGKAITATTSDAKSYSLLGVVTLGGGTSSNAQIGVNGTVTCTFDSAATAGDFVGLSTGTAGKCTDKGSSPPTDGTITLGFVAATISSAGNTTVYVRRPSAFMSTAVATSVVNDTNVTGSIAANALTLGWAGTLASGRLNSNVVQSVVNDTNVTGSIAAQALTLAWSGALAKARTLSTTVYTDQANTFGAFLQKFQGGANHQIVDPADTTKAFQFDVSNVATGTTRTVTVPNASSTTVQSDTGATNNYISAISAQGVISKSRPTCGTLSDSVASCSTDATNASNLSSGTVPAARLPNPSASTLGGVQSLASVASKWINTISTSGVPSASQPACGDLSDSAASCSTDATNASNISSGTLGAARNTYPPCFTATTADFSATTTTLLDITGLSCSLTTGHTYYFRVELIVLPDSTGGQKYAVSGTATASQTNYSIEAIEASLPGFTIASRGTTLGNAFAVAGGVAEHTTLQGTLICNGTGTLTAQFAQNSASGTSKVLQGSTLRVFRLN